MTDHSGAPYSSDVIEKMDHTKYGRSSRSRRRTIKIIILSVSLAVMSLVLVVVGVYSAVKISELNDVNRKLEYALRDMRDQMSGMEPELQRLQNELKSLVESRFPNLYELVTNQVLSIENDYIKNVVFTIIRQGNREDYKYLLVVENNTQVKIKPSFRVLLFDEFGVHIATDEVHDSHALSPGESRDYTSDIAFLIDTQPKHFYIDDITAQSAPE